MAVCVAHCSQKGYFDADPLLKWDMLESRGLWVVTDVGVLLRRSMAGGVVNIRRRGRFKGFDEVGD